MTTDVTGDLDTAVRQLLRLLSPGPPVGKDAERELGAAWQAAEAVRQFLAAAAATDHAARTEALALAARHAGWATGAARDRLAELATRAELDAVVVTPAAAFEGRL